MKRIIGYFEFEFSKPTNYPLAILKVVVLGIAVSLIGLGVCTVFDIELDGRPLGLDILSWSFVPILVAAVFAEEVIFRLLPLWLSVSVFKMTKGRVVLVAAVASVIFGYCHGGIGHVLIQGLVGFLFSLVYLGAGGFKAEHPKGVFCSFAAHLTFNSIIIAAVLISGERYL